jgi:DNA-binding NarL/FixJ family response regulator
VVVLTTFGHDEYVFEALRAGASGFLLKRATPEELIAAVHATAAGETPLAKEVISAVVSHVADSARTAEPGEELGRLTPREREVLQLLAHGRTNAEIAAALVIEASTVKSHVKAILAKLGLRDRVQAVIYAYESGLVTPGD